MCLRCHWGTYTTSERVWNIDICLTRYGFYNYRTIDSISCAGFYFSDDDCNNSDEDGITYRLDPPWWLLWKIIRCRVGHFRFKRMEGYLDACTSRFHSFE